MRDNRYRMEFENTFSVTAPIDEVFDALLDVERIAPCMPGAQVLERISDDAYKVGIKVKVGPVTMNYRGNVEIVDRDPEAHTAKLTVKAQETRGQGTATAEVAMRLALENGATHGTMSSDVRLSGKAAAMGRGIIQDVSARLVDEFAQNLATMLSAGEPAEAEGNGGGAAEPGPAAAESGAAATETGAAKAPPRPEPAESSVDALAVASSVIRDRLKRPQVLGALLGIAVLLRIVFGRRR
jgi:carbon monoxide dehydrogenase subunit G